MRTHFPDSKPIGETFGTAFMRVWNAYDRRTVDAEGSRTGPRTEGITRPMETVAYQARLIGKESRHLGTGRDILTPPEFSDYGGDDEWPDVLQTLQRLVRDQHLRASLFEESGLGTI